MSNPLYQQMGHNMPGPLGNMQNVMRQFQQFRQMFSGDPQQQVQQLLNSGRVSQQQYNNAVQVAQQLQKMLGGK